MQTLLTVIATWLAVNFGLPGGVEHPRVEFASAAEMSGVRYSRITAHDPASASTAASVGAHEVHAIYDDRSRTIYLPLEWTGSTPAEMSILVHEFVHHLQNVAGLEYDCVGAREKPAYRAQAKWLELFGTTLADEFELDEMTILVRTSCMF